jgi:hypothetical protein
MGFGTAFGTLLEEEISLARQGNLNRIFGGLQFMNFRMAPIKGAREKCTII